jgi:Vps52 / Sac2 family
MVQTELNDQLLGYHDVIGLLIMTRIVGHCQLLMIHAQAPVLDGFLDRIGLTLWPHYSKLIRVHIDAITPGEYQAIFQQCAFSLLHSKHTCVQFSSDAVRSSGASEKQGAKHPQIIHARVLAVCR